MVRYTNPCIRLSFPLSNSSRYAVVEVSRTILFLPPMILGPTVPRRKLQKGDMNRSSPTQWLSGGCSSWGAVVGIMKALATLRILFTLGMSNFLLLHKGHIVMSSPLGVHSCPHRRHDTLEIL